MFAFPVVIQTYMIQNQLGPIYYPQVTCLHDKQIEQMINQEIFQLVQLLIKQQYELQDTDTFTEMIGTFEIKTNERDILSLNITNYAYAKGFAHGLTVMRSLTFNVSTGKSYNLADLFNKESNFVEVLSANILEQIEEREIPMVNGFSSINQDQDYYIADKALVIYFQPYEITPGYIGFPMFPISVFTLENILKETGPLGIMATNS